MSRQGNAPLHPCVAPVHLPTRAHHSSRVGSVRPAGPSWLSLGTCGLGKLDAQQHCCQPMSRQAPLEQWLYCPQRRTNVHHRQNSGANQHPSRR